MIRKKPSIAFFYSLLQYERGVCGDKFSAMLVMRRTMPVSFNEARWGPIDGFGCVYSRGW
jgi:hypothetical protein